MMTNEKVGLCDGAVHLSIAFGNLRRSSLRKTSKREGLQDVVWIDA